MGEHAKARADVEAGKINLVSPAAGNAPRHKPGLKELLGALRLDLAYHRAQGSCLYYRDEHGAEVEVLDLVGGYGCLLLGHAHPPLTAEAAAFWQRGAANLAQGSIGPLSEALARELSRRAGGDYCAVWANSGAEAVEAAIKHAMLETGGGAFIALHGAFHGKSLGALQLTDNPLYRRPFGVATLDVRRVPPNDTAALDAAFAACQALAGCIVEPIQGEAGVRPLTGEFLRRAAELCRARRVPLVVDECQTGLGRTGDFLASRAMGVRPDYIILSKALGGGVAKRAAVLIERRRYQPEFDLLHTSTFADDEFSSAVAYKMLELVDDRLLATCREKGAWLQVRLREVKHEFPTALADVRGTGLLLGLELRSQAAAASFVLRFASSTGLLGPLIAAYLLHVHRLRLAPTLSDPLTLRLQPSALIEYEQLERVTDGVRDVCARLQRSDIAGLTRFLTRDARGDFQVALPRRENRPPLSFSPIALPPERTHNEVPGVAWLFHLIDETDLSRLEPGFAQFNRASRRAYLKRFSSLAEPVLMNPVDIRSRTGAQICLTPILLPVTSEWLRRKFHSRQLAPLRRLVQHGVEAARQGGCDIVSLGQFTSIVTRDGCTLSSGSLGLTTGNSFTAALAVEAVQNKLRDRDLDPSDATLAVIGAAGNIGRACVALLAPQFGRAILVGSGRPASQARLAKMAARFGAHVSTELKALRCAEVVVCAANTVDLALGPFHFAPETIVCDVSVPSVLHRDLAVVRPDLAVIDGGVCRLPQRENLGIPGFPLAPGYVYGCMAEGILLGFERDLSKRLVGPVSLEHVQILERLGAKHGLTALDSSNRLKTPSSRLGTTHAVV
jgi:acetylornithine/succinyldiaminopimelate/putrescine aminotransferase/predicted amino acid dehydrogenase